MKKFNADELADMFHDDCDTFELFNKKVEFEVCYKHIEISHTPSHKEFLNDLFEFAQDKLGRELTNDEIEELKDSWKLVYELGLNNWCESAIEHRIDEINDQDWEL